MHFHEHSQLEISSKCDIKAENCSTSCKFNERRKGLQPMGYNADHCWIADDVTAIMLVVKKKKNKNISLILELNPTFIKHISRKNYSVMTTNMAALFKWLKAKNRVRKLGGRTVRTYRRFC